MIKADLKAVLDGWEKSSNGGGKGRAGSALGGKRPVLGNLLNSGSATPRVVMIAAIVLIIKAMAIDSIGLIATMICS